MIDTELEPRFSLKELTDASGVNERNIRYYIEQELVPPAFGKGRSAYYTTTHLERLEQVKVLRDQGQSIEEIRVILTRQSMPDRLQSQVWERVTLHPDLEISIRSNAPEHVQALHLEIQQMAANWFGSQELDL